MANGASLADAGSSADKAAQEFIDSLAEVFDIPQNRVHRFTPSIKLGRRYLAVEGDDGFIYNITVEVIPK